VEAVEEKEEKKGGIVIPDIAKEKPMECRVVALGTGKTDDNGKKVPFEMKRRSLAGSQIRRHGSQS
jgi:chaperonin GroES